MADPKAEEVARALGALFDLSLSQEKDIEVAFTRYARSYAAEVEKAALERAAAKLEGYGDVVGAMAIRALLTPEPGDPQERPTHDGGNP